MGRKSCIGVVRSDWLYAVESGEVKAKGNFPKGLSLLEWTHKILEAFLLLS